MGAIYSAFTSKEHLIAEAGGRKPAKEFISGIAPSNGVRWWADGLGEPSGHVRGRIRMSLNERRPRPTRHRGAARFTLDGVDHSSGLRSRCPR